MHVVIGLASPSAARGNVKEDYMEERREGRENEHQGPKDKKGETTKGRKET